jgi:hypothetical protein
VALSTFGVTADSVRRHRFPHLDGFGASTAPSLSTVEEAVDRAAARLAGKLLLEAIDASAITDVTSAAYLWCQETLELMVAIRVAEAATHKDSELLRVWRTEVDARLKELDEGGADALGGGATTTSPSDPDGPTTHISQYSLTTDDSADMSTVVPRLRRDDLL